MALEIPTLRDVFQARKRIAPYLPRTPLFSYPALDGLLGATVFVKHENHQPIGAFKVRGGVNLVSQLSAEDRSRGVISASTGNHGQSIAYAARLFGVRAVICVPEGANPVKVAAMESLGAEVVAHGRDFDDAREHCEKLAEAEGYRYVHSGNEPHLIAGVATSTLEILEDEPGVEAIVAPIGGGSGASGACIVAKAIDPGITVFGVQAAAAPAAYRSWKEGRLVEDRMETYAEGLATRTAFELPQAILRAHLDDFVLVSDDEIRRAQSTLIATTKNLVEGAGAAAFAGALEIRDQLAGKKVAIVLSGGNASVKELAQVTAAP
ncbi:MAG TPA: threonine/serine dehydratase [Acidimicrobiales bacterium]|nr:threonine/serine dehydratase [Acidimicrobiales bacterium]